MATQDQSLIVLPRPGALSTNSQLQLPPISAPAEAAMTSTFGSLLPPAAYLTTTYGRAAYYVYPPLLAPAPTTTLTTTTTTTTTTRAAAPAPAPAPMHILMVHGVQTPALGLHPLATALRARFPHATIALFDHWGHGLSDTPMRPHTPPLFYDLIDRVLAQLGWSNHDHDLDDEDDKHEHEHEHEYGGVHLIGYSFGSSTIAGYVASGRERRKNIASMVHIAPAGFIDSSSFPEEVRTKYLSVRSSSSGTVDADERGAREWVLDFLEGGTLVVPSDWEARVARGEVVAEAIRDWEMRAHEGHVASVVAIVRDAAVLDNHATFAKAAETGVKTMAVLGELDDLSSAQDLYDAGISNVVVVPKAGHAVVRQNVHEVAQHIEFFWKNLGRAP